MFYYCNLSLICKKFYKYFNNYYLSSIFVSFKQLNKPNNSCYYITSKDYNIKFSKIYINKINNKYYLLYGTEGNLLATEKILNYNNNNKKYITKKTLQFLKFLSY